MNDKDEKRPKIKRDISHLREYFTSKHRSVNKTVKCEHLLRKSLKTFSLNSI